MSIASHTSASLLEQARGGGQVAWEKITRLYIEEGKKPYTKVDIALVQKMGALPMDLPGVGEDPLDKWGIKMPAVQLTETRANTNTPRPRPRPRRLRKPWRRILSAPGPVASCSTVSR
jgi:hypothetical protein